jgi:hypothetical protein
VTTDPEELDPELDAELGTADDELDDELDGDELPDGFVVEGGEEDDDEAVGDDDVDVGATILDITEAAAEDPDDFEEEIAPVVRVPDEEDEAPARRSGEFVCTRCFLVKRESQLAVRSRKVCRDCA